MIVKDTRAKEFLSGLLSAMVSISLTYPITKLIYRQILEKSSLKASFTKMKREGLRYSYRGILPPLFQRSTEISVMFGTYKTAELALHPLKLSMYDEKLASSTISGIVESILTPFERTQLLLMDSKRHGKFINTGHTFLILAKEYGPKEFFRGYTCILVRNICHNTFFFLMKDELAGLIKCNKAIRTSVQNFIVGSFVGLMMTTLFYPIKVVKTTMQAELGGKFMSIFEATRKVYWFQSKGLRNFYRGVGLNICRAMLGWGITNVSYEFIRSQL